MDQQLSYYVPLHTNYDPIPELEGSHFESPESETHHLNISRTVYSDSSMLSKAPPFSVQCPPHHASVDPKSSTDNFSAELQYPEEEYQDVHIHAPIPISSYSTLIPPPVSNTSTARSASGVVYDPRQTSLYSRKVEPGEQSLDKPLAAQSVPLYDVFNKERSWHRQTPVSSDRARSVSDTPEEEDTGLTAGVRQRPARRNRSQKKAYNQRKAYFRDVAQNVGFDSTDPDNITTHDKKRHYLESLEDYVLWLHEQIRFVGVEPPPLERILYSNGLDIRSIRTLLLHMQDESKNLYIGLRAEEQSFRLLREELLMRGLSVETQEGEEFRCDSKSIASDAIPAMASLQLPAL